MQRTTHRVGRFVLVVLMLGLLGVAAVSAPASADLVAAQTTDLPDVPSPQIGDSISDAEMEDLRTIAAQSDMTLEEAIERYAWNDNFALAVDKIRSNSPEAFTGAEIVDAHTAWVGFSGEMPQAATETLAEFGGAFADVSLDARTGMGFTETELEAAIEVAHFAAMEQSGVLDVVTTYSFDTGRITVVVALGQSVDAATLSRVEEAVDLSIGDRLKGTIEVSVVASGTPQLVFDDSNSYHHGGEVFSSCTSGFGTRASSHTSGTRGISTAGHCGNPRTDDGYTMTFKDEYDGTHGDFQWHTGPKTESDDFYSGNSTTLETNLRDVSSVGDAVVGQSLCKNGKTNYKDCQEVRKTSVCAGNNCNLVQMGARLAAGGDSGGPIFWSNTAYGLHTSSMYDPSWPFDRDVYSKATRMDNAIDVYVATS